MTDYLADDYVDIAKRMYEIKQEAQQVNVTVVSIGLVGNPVDKNAVVSGIEAALNGVGKQKANAFTDQVSLAGPLYHDRLIVGGVDVNHYIRELELALHDFFCAANEVCSRMYVVHPFLSLTVKHRKILERVASSFTDQP